MENAENALLELLQSVNDQRAAMSPICTAMAISLSILSIATLFTVVVTITTDIMFANTHQQTWDLGRYLYLAAVLVQVAAVAAVAIARRLSDEK